MERFKDIADCRWYVHSKDLHSNMERFKESFQDLHQSLYFDLHSNMERFKVHIFEASHRQITNLHSNMERFKVPILYLQLYIHQIYIPIWRDLKWAKPRFCLRALKIYIPIWRDLKFLLTVGVTPDKLIYIPIWRDLKYKSILSIMDLTIDLHSNMERFKAFATEKDNVTLLIYIPIWRDLKKDTGISQTTLSDIYIPIWRDLKSIYLLWKGEYQWHLHSNMERFKDFWHIRKWRTL